MLILMEATGARPGEIAALEWDDVNWERRAVRLDGKTGERWVKIPKVTLDELAQDAPRHGHGRVLPVTATTARGTIRKILRKACDDAGVRRFCPKQIRTMVENALFDAGADPGVVSAQLGHTPEVSLRHYRAAKSRRVEDVMEAAGLGVRPGSNVVSLAAHRKAGS